MASASNAKKTELVTTDRHYAPVIVDGESLEPQQTATMLGRVLHASKAKPQKCDPNHLLRRLRSRPADGLPVRPGMAAFQRFLAKMLYAANIFPPPVFITTIHLSCLRDLLQVRATRAYRCVLQRAAGTSFHLALQVHQRIFSRLGSISSSQRTALSDDNAWGKAASATCALPVRATKIWRNVSYT